MVGAATPRAAALLAALAHVQLVAAFAPQLQHGLSAGLRAAARPASATALVRPRDYPSPAQRPAALSAEARASVTEASPSLLASMASNAAALVRAVATALVVVLAVAVFSLQALLGLRDMAQMGASKNADAAASNVAVESRVDVQDLKSSRSKATLAVTVVSGVGFVANAYLAQKRLSKVSRRHG